MARARTAVIGRLAQWLLLACTLFGLATMHTLGHAGIQLDDHGVGHQRLVPSLTVDVVVSGVVPATAGPEDSCHGGCADGFGPVGHLGMVGWGVCVAVLISVAALLLAVLLSRLRHDGAASERAGPRPVVPRAPPHRPVGLRLATVSVLRT